MKTALQSAAICLLLMGAAAMVQAQDAKGFRADLLGQVAYVQKQTLDLENAIPDAKMTWRPNKEVRSVSEVYSHIAFANYLMLKMAGLAVPEDITMEGATKWEKASKDKKVIHDQLDKSFEFVKTSIKGMDDATLENMLEVFGQKMTTRSLLLTLLSHQHEHLGQSIAYARMVGVVPPWTAAQVAAEKAQK
jgi:uncharacterized damage-inducible protein DinB